VIDDFAHHPTAVAATIDAARQSYPKSRIVVAYEPRSLTAGREFLFPLYLEAFSDADRVFFAPVFHHERLGDERIDLERLTAELAAAGTVAVATQTHSELSEQLLDEIRWGDVVITMSSGNFEGLARKLADGVEDAQAKTLA